jgi:GxxExxY protein
MPIELSTPIRVVTQDEYHAIDRVMLGHAFGIHNEYGRLLDEKFYKAELARRCSGVGLAVAREVLIRVRHGQFSKDYFIDLLLDGSTIIEGKCAQTITPAHRGQTLNYLLLSGTHHGSLVNFRPFRVKREFVSTQLTHDIRQRFTLNRHHWPDDAAHQKLLDVAGAFCADVGLGLDLTLYRQAFTTLMGGPSLEPQPVAIFGGERVVHEQAMYMVTADVGLAVTAMPSLDDTRRHLQRLLNNTRLQGIAWINLPLNELRLEFLSRQNHQG